MSLYAIDPLHPELLVCTTCHATIGTLAADSALDLDDQTADQAARLWPELAAELRYHDALCPVRGQPTLEELERWARAG